MLNMLKLKRLILPGTIFFIIIITVVPTGPAYGMSQIKSLVNKVRPGTFPEMESGAGTESDVSEEEGMGQEALTETEKQILLSLMERKRQLDQRELVLNQREEQLRALRDNIQRQVTELKKLQVRIEAGMEAKKAQDAENLKKVVGLYDGMDPKKAAEKFQQLNSKIAVMILMAMNQRKASALMEELPPEQAKRITEEIVRKVPSKN